MHVAHLEACQIERPSHLTVAVGTLLADDGGHRFAAFFATGNSLLGEDVAQRLVGKVVATLLGATARGLPLVQQIRGIEPALAHGVDVEMQFAAGIFHIKLACLLPAADIVELDPFHAQVILYELIGRLDYHARKLAEQHVGIQITQVYVEAALDVGKHALEQRCDKTAGGDVVAGEDEFLRNQRLDRLEALGEICGVSDVDALLTHCRANLCVGTSAQREARLAVERYVKHLGGNALEGGMDGLGDVTNLAHRRYYQGAGRDDLLSRRIFLGHRHRVFAGRDIDTQRDGKVGRPFDSLVQAGILALVAGRPHPVGTERHSAKAAVDGCPDHIGEGLGDGQARPCRGIYQARRGSMTDGGSNTAIIVVADGGNRHVVERELYLARSLLAGDKACHGAVHLVGEPVLAGHRLEREHVLNHFFQRLGSIAACSGNIGICLLYGGSGHHRLGSAAHHVTDGQIYRGCAGSAVLKGKVMFASSCADLVERGAFALGYGLQMVCIGFFHHQTHSLLALVADNLLIRKGRVADGELGDVNGAAHLLYQLGETVEVTAGAVVMHRDDAVALLFCDGADGVVGSLLHLGVGTLHRVEFYGVGIFACSHRAHCAAAHADAVVVAAQQHHCVASARSLLDGVALAGITHTAGLHDDLVVAVHAACVAILEGEQRTADYRLAKLVAKVAGTVAGLDEYLLRGLVEPLALLECLPCAASLFETGVAGHIDCRAGNRERALAARHTVADFAAGTGRSAVERLYGGGEVVRLGLERDHRLGLVHHELRRARTVFRMEHLQRRALDKCAIVFVCRYHPVGVGLGRLLDQLEQRRGLLLAVNYKRTVENLVAAVLAVDLAEAEHLAVGKAAAQLCREVLQVLDLFR